MMNFSTIKEVVYSLNHGNTITVCLAQTHHDHIPFISTLEVRSLDSDTYNYVDSDYPLFFLARRVYGTNRYVRYSEDSYDRIWWPGNGPEHDSTDTWVDNTAPVVQVNISDKIPEALFRTALTSLNSSGEIWRWGIFKNLSVPLQFNAYFSEVIQLNSTQKRSFDIKVLKTGDNVVSVYDTVIPPYGHALKVCIENITTNSSDVLGIGLVPTKDSTLPPLISALEGYVIGDKLVQGTNLNDVNSLGLLQKSFNQLQDWQDDPCLPSPYTWDWVACDSDPDSPRFTALYLNDLGLVGTLPDFSAMDALEIIDLHNNSLIEAIPEFLGTIPKLKVLEQQAEGVTELLKEEELQILTNKKTE
ncbi:probable LRR receptor-like serine/threonine-protein kinase At1g05700 [Papaver somniferum]|uniref:probable LRR receptor-like serine/threonine-protein kinase At1g05700 n=1 Tax=Papaver somniferum TaxID=3469 RepID=UPI000E6FD495|nr:probable LRR receptor-like serine/threonine-protein kinase At1g05700 [Papaver somniferum]